MERVSLFRSSSIIVSLLLLVSCSQYYEVDRNEYPIPVVNPDGKYGYINIDGKVVIPFTFRYAGFFSSSGLAPAVKDSLFGYINVVGQWAIAPVFTFAYPFSGGFAKVSKDRDYYVVNSKGEFVFDIDEEVYTSFPDRFNRAGVAVCKSLKDGFDFYYLLDTCGNVLFESERRIEILGDNLLILSYKKDSSIIADFSGRFLDTVVDRVGDGFRALPEGSNSRSWYYQEGNCFYGHDFSLLHCFSDTIDLEDVSEGMIEFCTRNYRHGYLNEWGDIVVEPIYESAFRFQEGLAEVKKNGKYGFIDREGRVVVPFKYSGVYYGFKDSYAIVGEENERDSIYVFIFLDKAGREFWKFSKKEGLEFYLYRQVLDFR